MILLTIKLICLDSMETNDLSTTIYFNHGQSCNIHSTIKNYTYATTLLQRSLQREHPVALSINADGQVIEILRADSDYITAITENNQQQIQIHFQGHDGAYYLNNQNKNFDILLQKITTALHSKERIWFITSAPGLTVYDIMLESELKKLIKKKWWE